MPNIELWAFLFFILTQVILFTVYLARVKRVGPNQALIVYGRRPPGQGRNDVMAAFRIVVGGRTFVWPFVERAEYLSLEPARAEVPIGKAVTGDGQQVTLAAAAQFAIKSDSDAISKAACLFLSKTEAERTASVMEVLESHLRRVVEGATLAEIKMAPSRLAEAVVDQANSQMEQMGIEIISLIIKETA